MKQKPIKIRGKVKEVLPDFKYKVVIKTGETETEILAYLSGRLVMHKIKVLEEDEVELECSPYDLTKGRIVRRH
jgi:translation initiation factor IF-1